MADIIPLHRGFVRPHSGAQLSKMVSDPDAAFAPEPVDLDAWLNRDRDPDESFAQAILCLIRDNAKAATAGFLVGFIPFLVMLAIMVLS